MNDFLNFDDSIMFKTYFAYFSALRYRIVYQDGISLQGEKIAILNKHAGSNKMATDPYH